MEQHKSITDYPNYEISSHGNVRNRKTGKLLSLCPDTGGYLKVSLHGTPGKKTFKVHRLVAIHFVDNPDNKPTVDHIDNDRTNNNAVNLRWATSQEQARNTGLSKANTSGIKGVYYIDFWNEYQALVMIDGVSINLGMYDTIEEAKQARTEEVNDTFFGLFANPIEGNNI
jgi:hypothetical protein